MSSNLIDEDRLSSEGIEIRNIVAKSDIDTELDLDYLHSQFPNSSYEPEQYPSLIFRPENLPTVLITNSGILLFTGANSMDLIISSYEEVSNQLKNIGLSVAGEEHGIEIQNIVATFKLKNEVDLEQVSIYLGVENVEYEPEQFPGLVYQTESGPSALVFSSGKVVITGGESTHEIRAAASMVREQLPSIFG
jgi:transcription initiation factor TFIID TATA-box-binding protein